MNLDPLLSQAYDILCGGNFKHHPETQNNLRQERQVLETHYLIKITRLYTCAPKHCYSITQADDPASSCRRLQLCWNLEFSWQLQLCCCCGGSKTILQLLTRKSCSPFLREKIPRWFTMCAVSNFLSFKWGLYLKKTVLVLNDDLSLHFVDALH